MFDRYSKMSQYLGLVWYGSLLKNLWTNKYLFSSFSHWVCIFCNICIYFTVYIVNIRNHAYSSPVGLWFSAYCACVCFSQYQIGKQLGSSSVGWLFPAYSACVCFSQYQSGNQPYLISVGDASKHTACLLLSVPDWEPACSSSVIWWY